MPPANPLLPFAKSVFFGAVAGAAPYLLFSILFAILGLPRALTDPGEFLAMLALAVLPLAVAIPVVLTGSIVVGLPVTAALKRWDQESAAAYIGIGAASGAALTLLLLFLIAAPPDSEWLAIFGALSGAVTGLTWWLSWRKPNVI